MSNEPDSYYQDKSQQYLAAALADCEARGITDPERIRFELRRAYPFGPLRKGRAYKIWQKVILAKEAELGYVPKRHRKTIVREQELAEKLKLQKPKRQVVLSDILRKSAQGETAMSKTATVEKPKPELKLASVKPRSALDEFIAANPKPMTREAANLFLREHCKVALFMNRDHDLLRVTLKGSNVKEWSCKSEFRCELQTDDPEEWDIVFIEAAVEAWKLWMERETWKY